MTDQEKNEPQDEVSVSEENQEPTPDASPPENDAPASDAPPDAAPAEDAGATSGGDQPEAGQSDEEVEKELNKVVNENDMSENDAEAAMMAMLEDLPEEKDKPSAEDIDFGGTEVSNAQFQHLSESASSPPPRNIELLMDVNLPISIELGRTRMSISDILGLGAGSVVELNKLAGEPVDVMVNGKIVAKGEVVVIDENFGVRITQLMTPQERLKLLSDEQ